MKNDADAQGQKLNWIELGRGVAAICVVLSHSALADIPTGLRDILKPFGTWGVAFFFVLSGFIIFFVHEKDLGNTSRAPHFALRRALRIFPTYWLVFSIDLTLHALFATSTAVTDISGPFLVQQWLILPGAPPFVEVAWTLRNELLFYAVFLVAILNLRAGLVAAAIWILAAVTQTVYAGAQTAVPQTAMQIATSHLNLYFVFGMAVAYAFRRGLLHFLTGLMALAALASGIAATLSDSTEVYATFQAVTCTCIVCCAVYLSLRSDRAPRLFGLLGAMSYPLYLFHETAFYITGGLLKRASAHTAWATTWQMKLLISMIISFAGAYLINRFFEKNVAYLTRRRAPTAVAKAAHRNF